MAKLSEPIAKAFETLMNRCKGDVLEFLRILSHGTIHIDYNESHYNAVALLRCVNINDLILAIAEGLPQAIKATEQPSKAAAVEGILTEEELNNLILRLLSTAHSCEKHPEFLETGDLIKIVKEIPKFIKYYQSILSANAELSFKKEIFKRAVEDIIVAVDFCDDNTVRALAFKALEDGK